MKCATVSHLSFSPGFVLVIWTELWESPRYLSGTTSCSSIFSLLPSVTWTETVPRCTERRWGWCESLLSQAVLCFWPCVNGVRHFYYFRTVLLCLLLSPLVWKSRPSSHFLQRMHYVISVYFKHHLRNTYYYLNSTFVMQRLIIELRKDIQVKCVCCVKYDNILS